MFDGGWMWIIPFDNFHRSASTLCSIGLLLDPEKYPLDDSLSPEEEMKKLSQHFQVSRNSLATLRLFVPMFGQAIFNINR